jgi:hypothetical protein
MDKGRFSFTSNSNPPFISQKLKWVLLRNTLRRRRETERDREREGEREREREREVSQLKAPIGLFANLQSCYMCTISSAHASQDPTDWRNRHGFSAKFGDLKFLACDLLLFGAYISAGRLKV